MSIKKQFFNMKYTEFHRKIAKSGWRLLPGEGKGSHRMYEKNGLRYTVPFHGAKEIAEPLRKKISKDMGL